MPRGGSPKLAKRDEIRHSIGDSTAPLPVQGIEVVCLATRVLRYDIESYTHCFFVVDGCRSAPIDVNTLVFQSLDCRQLVVHVPLSCSYPWSEL